MDEIKVTRLICALDLLRYKASDSKKSGHAAIYEDDINEILIVAGLEPLKADREVKSNDIV